MTLTDYTVRKLRETLVCEGKRVAPTRTVKEHAAYFKQEYARFWEEYTRQDMPHIYKVDLSSALYALKREMVEKIGRGET
jgi:nicotinate phosphoribosyltransferase